jgi:hypothetical protein
MNLGENFSSGRGKGINQLSKCQNFFLLREEEKDGNNSRRVAFGLHWPAFVLNRENGRQSLHAYPLSPWCFP